ncbi:hypothetical protein QJS10_CPA05g00044 [Acorus calamus]|uniref:HMA domain-containing protein n=1 Tax=Acorus calamus TaxID=4465 RepID=A0AAV9EYR7_ACOCL|nr:hypothetical protein QJS10_CPA05g00044 [Acorus calamus]
MKNIVLKIGIYCLKCKTDVMKTIGKLEGADSITVDTEKGTATVVGSVDPVLVVRKLRHGKVVGIVSIEPNKPPETPKQPADKKTQPFPVCLAIFHE